MHSPTERRLRAFPAAAPGERGSALVSLLILLVLTVVAVPIAFGVTANAVKAKKSAALRRDVEQMRDYLRENVGCAESFPRGMAAACRAGTYVELRSRADAYGHSRTLVASATLSAPFTRWNGSSLVVRAWCSLDPETRAPRLLVQANRISPTGQVLPDPRSGLMMSGKVPTPATTTNNGWQDDLFDGAKLCRF
jgi:hypothetical protein